MESESSGLESDLDDVGEEDQILSFRKSEFGDDDDDQEDEEVSFLMIYTYTYG